MKSALLKLLMVAVFSIGLSSCAITEGVLVRNGVNASQIGSLDGDFALMRMQMKSMTSAKNFEENIISAGTFKLGLEQSSDGPTSGKYIITVELTLQSTKERALLMSKEFDYAPKFVTIGNDEFAYLQIEICDYPTGNGCAEDMAVEKKTIDGKEYTVVPVSFKKKLPPLGLNEPRLSPLPISLDPTAPTPQTIVPNSCPPCPCLNPTPAPAVNGLQAPQGNEAPSAQPAGSSGTSNLVPSSGTGTDSLSGTSAVVPSGSNSSTTSTTSDSTATVPIGGGATSTTTTTTTTGTSSSGSVSAPTAEATSTP